MSDKLKTSIPTSEAIELARFQGEFIKATSITAKELYDHLMLIHFQRVEVSK